VRRFWGDVTVEEENSGWAIRLDGRPVLTPARRPLGLPNRALADAVADEWRSVGAEVDPRTMSLTGFANAAIDRVLPERPAFAAGLGRYAEADLACYRSEWPPELVDRQRQCWDPLLAWARRRYDLDFATTSGLMPVPQPAATVDRLVHEVTAIDPFRLAGLSALITIGGSLIVGLALLEKAISAEEAWAAVSIDERWQIEKWGSDNDAEQTLENRRRDFLAAARFLELLE
jgi:chaperone required for assembly of F1-ATPase